jgi:hypothetical protein
MTCCGRKSTYFTAPGRCSSGSCGPDGAEAAALEEAESNHRRRLALERTYQTVQAHERDIRAAAERVQTELDVLRRER